MSFIEAIILAIIEGLTEFLPISSTGHMIIASTIMGNASEYSIKYQVRTKKGDYVNISITDLTK